MDATARRVLLVARFGDGVHAHNALRQRALERLGCEVRVVDMAGGGGLLGRLRGAVLPGRVRDALRTQRPDLVVAVDADELAPDAIGALRREHPARWVHWLCDATRPLARAADLAVAYDQVFVNGADVAAALDGVGFPPVALLPPGCDPSVHRPLRATELFRANVAFVGRATPRREAMLAGLAGFGLALWGEGWRRTALRDYCRGEKLDVVDYLRAYAGATVAVNLHHEREGSDEPGDGLNPRLFELAALGAAQVVDRRPGLEACFDPRHEVVAVGDARELKAVVGDLVHAMTAAERLGQAARQRALREHTYMHRMRVVLGP